MTQDLLLLKKQLNEIINEFSTQADLKPGQILVIGCSTSEVIGEKIGTAGSEEVASVIFDELTAYASKNGLYLAFQCCEHLNRSLVIERELMNRYNWEEVSVIPVRTAGGAMATYAFQHFQDPVVIEFIKGDAGIDIGNTLIGMHLKHVAVPIRVKNHTLGSTNVILARTRPKLIGGARAVYENKMNELNESC